MIFNFRNFLLLTAFLHLTVAQVHAQEEVPAPTMAEDDVDALITNKKMRTTSGSKSKYSVSMGLSYAGGSLAEPLGTVRPNITGATGSTDVALMSGSISGKYTLTTQSSLFAGVGVRWITPFAGSQLPKDYNGDKVDADNPSISYQYLYRWLGNRVQSSFQLSEGFFTASNLLRQGYLTNWGVSQNNMYEIGHSGVSFGLSISAGFAVFTKDDPVNKAGQSDYNFSLTPSLEYKVTDWMDVRTDSNLIAYMHMRSEARPTAFRGQVLTQSLGLGFPITRDFYLSPGLLWVAGKLSSDSTLVSLGANLNIF